MRLLRRRPLLAPGLLLVALGLLAACSSTKPDDRVHVLTWKGIVNPVMARYVDRGIDTAERSNGRAVILRIDTPGGLSSSMRDIIQRIEAAELPVIVYVSPAGGRAASAGTFITMAGHVAAMAPNTTIGAATPINASGEDIEGALGRKVINDSVAYIRSIAELRGRNADWAESAVRDAAAVGEVEAVDLNVVDFVAVSIGDLLIQSDGRQVQLAGMLAGETEAVRTAGAETVENNTNLFEEVLDFIATPDIAFLLLSLGGLALIIEILTPGFGIGVFGVIALILAFFALGALPTNEAGVALIIFGLILILAEVFASGFGIFGIGGIACLVFGGLFLTGSSEVGFQVSRWLVIGFGVFFGGAFLLLARALFKLRKMRSAGPFDAATIVGAKGVTRSRLDPHGYVQVAGERWEALAEDPPIEEETDVIVTESAGVHVVVKRDPASIKLLPAGEVRPGPDA